MKTTALILFTSAVLLAAGCKTTETKPVTWNEQQAYMAKVKNPQRFGYSIYQTPSGIEYRGGSRLHPNQAAELSMKAEEPLRPVVMLRGKFGLASPLLLDFTASSSWMEFDLAQTFGSQPVGEDSAQLVKTPGEEIAGCLSVVPTVRLDQLYIENPLVYVRLANGPLGTVARGIEKPELKAVMGWDLLRMFGRIRLDYPEKRIVLATVETAYVPNPAFLVAKIPLMNYAGACVVRGAVDGKAGPILIDPAGDFEVATDGAAAVSSVQLGAGLIFSAPAVSNSPGGTRIGARLLQSYIVTVCPQAGVIYFERPASGKNK
ncbi:MAG: hypothetical protein WCH86_00090 [Kiritimatiellales bacterium]